MKEKHIWRAFAVVGGAVLVWAIATSRFFTANVRYFVRRHEGPFEIRDYPDLRVAEISHIPDDNRAFNRLFAYIRGANSTGRSIPMTAPVLIERASASERMAFVMPEEMPAPPEPRHGAVQINARPAARFAVFRFHGWPRRENERRAIAALRHWLLDRNLPATADPIIAYYDPPWTPPPLRRNEVLLRLPR